MEISDGKSKRLSRVTTSTILSTIPHQHDSAIGSSISHSLALSPASPLPLGTQESGRDYPSSISRTVPARKLFAETEVIEISSDSEPSTPISDRDNSWQSTLQYLHQRYSNNFGCSNHFPAINSSSSSLSHWSLSEVNRFLDQNLPEDYPVPGQYGYSGNISEEQLLKLLCGITTSKAAPPTLQIPFQPSDQEFLTTYDIDRFIAKTKCLSVAKRGLRIQFSPSCLNNISSDLHLYSTVEERSVSEKILSHQVPLHHIPHFHLGLLPSSIHLPLYVLLPSLWNSSSTYSSYISNHHLQQ